MYKDMDKSEEKERRREQPRIIRKVAQELLAPHFPRREPRNGAVPFRQAQGPEWSRREGRTEWRYLKRVKEVAACVSRAIA